MCTSLETHDAVADLGCGLGDLLTYLLAEHKHRGSYLGLDSLPEFVEHCQSRFLATNQAEFRVLDATHDELPRGRDWWLISGMFNNIFRSTNRHRVWIRSVLARVFKAANKGLAFNALSTIGAHQVAGLYYQDPEEVMGWCSRNLSANFSCRHDYNPPAHEGVAPDFTLHIYK